MGLDKGFLEFDRIEPQHEAPAERARHFREFTLTLTREEARRQSARCMDCGIPFCSHMCPLHNLVPDYLQCVTDGDYESAWAILSSTNSFPEITGRICPALCEEGCCLGIHRKAVGSKSVERRIAEHAFANGLVRPEPAAERTGCRVAVVGSGPAGLACAQQLARAGHEVTVYEKADRPGGLMRYGIPDFKLPREVLDRRLEQIVREGVRFVLGARIIADDEGEGAALEKGVHDGSTERIPVSRLMAANDAVVLATGAEAPRDLSLPGRELAGVHFALDFLIAQNRAIADGAPNPIDVRGRRVVVIGGGETASDCIGTAVRLGAASVTQLDYHAELPEVLSDDERLAQWPDWRRVKRSSPSHEEGCVRRFSTSTTEFLGEESGERLRAVRTVQVAWGPGRVITPVEGTEEEISADVVLIAMGYAHPDQGLIHGLGLATDRRGSIAAQTEGARAWRTGTADVFAAGDARSGQSLVVNAIAEGRRCAEAVNAWLAEKREGAAPLWR